MSKTIIFKPEFEKKLKRLKIKTKFVRNLRNCKFVYTNLGLLNITNDWEDFIRLAFKWSNSPEGFEYWDNIANLLD